MDPPIYITWINKNTCLVYAKYTIHKLDIVDKGAYYLKCIITIS